MLLTSFSVIGLPSIPTSPIIPDRIAVPPTPTVTSRTISAVMSSTVRRPMSTGWYSFWYHPAPHHHVEASGLGNPRYSQRVPAEADAGNLDNGAAAVIPELHGLFDGGLLVHQNPVVPDGLQVPGQVQLVDGQLLVPQAPVGGWRVIVRRNSFIKSDEQVLVHQRGTQFVRVHRAPDRHNLPGHIGHVRAHWSLLAAMPSGTMAMIVIDTGHEIKEPILSSFRPQPESRLQPWVRGVLGNQNRRRVLGPGCDRDDRRGAD